MQILWHELGVVNKLKIEHPLTIMEMHLWRVYLLGMGISLLQLQVK